MSLRNAGRVLAVTLAALMMPRSAGAWPPRNASTIEAAPPGAGYDYIVHVQNTYDYRYNPQVRADRFLLARQIVKSFCSRNKIVGENKFKTAIFPFTTGKPDYVVYVKCL